MRVNYSHAIFNLPLGDIDGITASFRGPVQVTWVSSQVGRGKNLATLDLQTK